LDILLAEVDQLKVAGEKRAVLEELVAAIELRLQSEPLPEADDSLADQVDSLVLCFDAEHPSLGMALKNIMMTLTSMGI
jgi:hypothetical protein